MYCNWSTCIDREMGVSTGQEKVLLIAARIGLLNRLMINKTLPPVDQEGLLSIEPKTCFPSRIRSDYWSMKAVWWLEKKLLFLIKEEKIMFSIGGTIVFWIGGGTDALIKTLILLLLKNSMLSVEDKHTWSLIKRKIRLLVKNRILLSRAYHIIAHRETSYW